MEGRDRMADVTGGAEDPANGYEALSAEFVARRDRSTVGAETVRQWARSLPAGASVLDLGCGSGVPITRVLLEEALDVWAIDASPRMIETFRARFPTVPARCEPVETSTFFDRTFDGVVAWGLLFLLPEEVQLALIRRVAERMTPGGSFLFTAPVPACSWTDVLTRRTSRSLGAEVYRDVLRKAEMTVVGEHQDEGGNDTFVAVRG